MYRNKIKIAADNPARLAPALLDALDHELRESRARILDDGPGYLHFSCGMGRPRSWRLPGGITNATIRVEVSGEQVELRYEMSLLQRYIAGTVTAMFFPGIAVLSGLLPLFVVAIVAGALWLWMVVISILGSKALFDHFLRRCIRRAKERARESGGALNT